MVLPAYNEEANIERVIRQVAAYLDPLGIDYEILPVNDGSRDRTGEILAAVARELPRVKPQIHPQNRGYGAALRTGFDAAVKRYVFYMDGDGQFDIKDLDKLLPLASEDVIVTGFRIERRDPFIRRLNAQPVRRLAGAGDAERLRPATSTAPSSSSRRRSSRPSGWTRPAP